MTVLTAPFREEHRHLLARLEMLRAVADSIGDTTHDALRRGIDEVYDFLTDHLLPHAQAEDLVLYPAVGRCMGAPLATATMSRDHVEVDRLTEELAALRSELAAAPLSQVQEKAMRRVLYSLYVLVRVHFEKEEEIYLPLLEERLSPDEARETFEAMEALEREH